VLLVLVGPCEFAILANRYCFSGVCPSVCAFVCVCRQKNWTSAYCLANAKRPCDCSVLCLRPRSSLCSCAHTFRQFLVVQRRRRSRRTSAAAVAAAAFQTWRHSAVVTKILTVCAQCSKCQREVIKKARVNGGVTMTLLRIPTRVSVAVDRPALFGNQTISFTRPSCWIQISTVDVINIAADHQMSMTLSGELSWQRLRQSAVDFYSKNEKTLFKPPFWALRGNVRTPSIARWKARRRLYIRRNWTFFTISYRWDFMSRNRSKSAFFRRGWVTLSADFKGNGHRPPTIVGVRKLQWLPFRVVSKYSQCVV